MQGMKSLLFSFANKSISSKPWLSDKEPSCFMDILNAPTPQPLALVSASHLPASFLSALISAPVIHCEKQQCC